MLRKRVTRRRQRKRRLSRSRRRDREKVLRVRRGEAVEGSLLPQSEANDTSHGSPEAGDDIARTSRPLDCQTLRMRAITDGGLETTLIYHHGATLPEFAAFVLLDDATGLESLRRYYAPYVEIARRERVRAILDTPTWRANADRGTRLGYDAAALADVNRRAVELLDAIHSDSPDVEIAISGCIGPRGDGYVVGETMTAAEAEGYHAQQVRALTGADLVSAITMTYPAEAIGVVRAARSADRPVVISFTVETNGELPNGRALADAVAEVDEATDGAAEYFMVNCAHPSHFAHVLPVERVRGVRANASKLSHAELDAAEALDEGDPAELAQDYAALGRLLPLDVVGGCCGTDHRHVGAIAAALSVT